MSNQNTKEPEQKVLLTEDQLEDVSGGLFIQRAGLETCPYCHKKSMI